MKRFFLPALILLVSILTAPSLCQDAISKFAPKAELIFIGTILMPRASTIDAQDVSWLAVVRMDEFLYGPKTYMNFVGKNITVQLKEPEKAKAKSRSLFFATGWYFSGDIGVIEIGRMPIDAAMDIKEIVAMIGRVRQEAEDDELILRLSQAQLVVRGRIIDIKRVPGQNKLSEHSPNWREAEIEIGKVLKGNFSGRTIKILFPSSNDVMWYNSPKPQMGTEGIWLLKQFTYAGKKLELLTAIDKADFLPKSDEERIVRLLKK